MDNESHVQISGDQRNGGHDWQKVDARVLGQILAAQNIVFALPDTVHIAEFYVQTLLLVPGILACRVCLGNKSIQAGEVQISPCAECEGLRKPGEQDDAFISLRLSLKCNLDDQVNIRVIPIDSYQHHFGFFVFQIESADLFDAYQPFIRNLSNYVAIVLENRIQRNLLQKARDELEERVEERTRELTAANEALASSRLSALQSMQDAIVAQRQAESANTDLQREISERQRAEDALKEQYTTLRSIIDSMNAIIFSVDRQYRYTSFNREHAAVMKAVYDAEIETGHSFLNYMLRTDEMEIAKRDLDRALAGEHLVEDVYLTKAPRAQQFFQVSHSPIKAEAGDVIGVAVLAQDLTERKQVEEQIRKLNQDLERRVHDRTAQLEQVNRELEAFAYSVSHDLRAPLRHIDGFIEMLRRRMGTSFDEQSQHYMDVISESAKRMGTLIDDLLSFSRMGRSEMLTAQVQLGELIEGVISEFKPEAEGRNIKWQIARLPPVIGDRSMLRLVITNLISNALKFTRSRKQAKIEIGFFQEGENETIFFIRDNGVGFDMNYTDKLFRVFQRLHHQDDFEGTGIGLANVRRIINRHGGRTWAEGKVDQGATFYFSLPTSKKDVL